MRQTSKVSPLTSSVSFFLFARRLEKSLLHPSEQKTSQPSALVAIIDCSALWLQICHRHICLTRRAPYKGKPLCSLHRRTENFLRTRRARACPRRLHCRYQRRNGGSKRPPYDYLNHLYTQKRGRTHWDSSSLILIQITWCRRYGRRSRPDRGRYNPFRSADGPDCPQRSLRRGVLRGASSGLREQPQCTGSKYPCRPAA